jgi:hypothetical protein
MSAQVVPFVAGATPTGVVEFYDSSTLITTGTLTGGFATISPTLTPGLHLLVARYLGDGTFVPSLSPPVLVTVYNGPRPAPTGVAIATAPNPSTLGANVTLTATLTGGATTGFIVFFDNEFILGVAPVANAGGVSQATLTRTTLPVGAHVITASYAGSPGFASSNSVPAVQLVQ